MRNYNDISKRKIEELRKILKENNLPDITEEDFIEGGIIHNIYTKKGDYIVVGALDSELERGDSPWFIARSRRKIDKTWISENTNVDLGLMANSTLSAMIENSRRKRGFSDITEINVGRYTHEMQGLLERNLRSRNVFDEGR